MAERIDYPQLPSGNYDQQMRQMYNYLYQTAQILNLNMQQIGADAFTDEELALVNLMNSATMTEEEKAQQVMAGRQEAVTLKSLIIKTAEFVRTAVDNYRLVVFGEENAESMYGSWNRKQGLRVDVTPEGIQQTYSYAEIVRGLKTYEINAKNYIKTGLLRTEDSIPVYGVAIGKDVVTFSEDGTETYNDGNKVAELTADELSFYQNGYKVGSYTASKITLNSGGSKRLEIDGNGIKFYKGDTIMAEMTPAALQFYYNGTLRAKMDSNGMTVSDGNTKLAEMLSSALKFYYNGTLRAQMDTDGISFWNGSTKLAEMTPTELSFWQGGKKVASYTGTKTSFYSNDTEVFYLQSGKMYCVGEMEISGTGQLVINTPYFYVNSRNLVIDDTGLVVSGGTVKANLYTSDGTPPLSRNDIVVSSDQPAAESGRVWIKPQDSVTAVYTAPSAKQKFSNAATQTFQLSGTAVAGQTGSNYYTLEIPVFCSSSSGGTQDFVASISDGTNTITFPTDTIPEARYIDGSTIVTKWVHTLTLTAAAWIATANELTLTVTASGGTSWTKETHGVDVGEIILRGNSVGSSGAGWKNCEVKVYQG